MELRKKRKRPCASAAIAVDSQVCRSANIPPKSFATILHAKSSGIVPSAVPQPPTKLLYAQAKTAPPKNPASDVRLSILFPFSHRRKPAQKWVPTNPLTCSHFPGRRRRAAVATALQASGEAEMRNEVPSDTNTPRKNNYPSARSRVRARWWPAEK